MRTARRMLKDVRTAWLIAFAFSAFVNLLMLVTPLYTLQIFDSVVPLGSIETLLIISAIAAVAIVALAILEIARDMILLRASVWLDHELGRHILDNGLKAGCAPQDLKRDARALDDVQRFLASPSAGVLLDVPFTPLFLIALLALSPVIGAVAVAAAGLLVAAALVQYALTSRLQSETAEAHERSAKWWTTMAAHGHLAGALGLVAGGSSRWEQSNRAHIAASYSLGKRGSVVKSFARMIRTGSQIALYGVGAWMVVRSDLAPGALVASAILLARALGPLEGLVGSVKALKAVAGAYRKLKALPEDVAVPGVTDAANGVAGRVSLQDVTYYHPTRKTPALRGVSLAIEPSECLALVGPNGAGKTTLAAILAGVVTPTSGSADLDGVPIAKWQRGDGFPPVGYYSDEPLLLEGSVHDNIARFRDLSLVGVARAAMRAGVHDTLQSLQLGFDTQVGPQGAYLALRERRAVALARAVAGAPRLVILDEPEAGLDGASMKRLLAMLVNLKAEGVGLVIITQDPRLLQLADKIAVLGNGALQIHGKASDVSQNLALRANVQREAV